MSLAVARWLGAAGSLLLIVSVYVPFVELAGKGGLSLNQFGYFTPVALPLSGLVSLGLLAFHRYLFLWVSGSFALSELIWELSNFWRFDAGGHAVYLLYPQPATDVTTSKLAGGVAVLALGVALTLGAAVWKAVIVKRVPLFEWVVIGVMLAFVVFRSALNIRS